MSGSCLRALSLRCHPIPPRTIEESHRPRVSDRTICCHSSGGQRLGLLYFRKTMGAVTTAKWNHRKKLLLRTSGDEPRPQGLKKTTLGVDVQTVGLNAEKKTPASSRWRALFSAETL